jgi:hypothetical protein
MILDEVKRAGVQVHCWIVFAQARIKVIFQFILHRS